MGEFVDAVLSFPTVVFTPLLVVVIGYWIVVIVGGADPEGDSDGGDFDSGPLSFLGLTGVPVSVILSLLVAFAWFGSLAGAQLITALPLWVVLVASLVVAWLITRLALLPLTRLWPHGKSASRADFIGLTCVIRTGTVTPTFGQAEVHAPDGSSAIVQVRQTGKDDLRAGMTAVLYDHDQEGEFFWVVPTDVATQQ